ncbi:MAG TPA: DUF6504 family protein [Dermatophilaceae bacterium]|nr:DUF6504 family protein [Dermatophilaceae bacterium]
MFEHVFDTEMAGGSGVDGGRQEDAVVRRYDEPIEVRAARVERPTGYAPDAFLWRGRLFVVRTVQDQWQERRAWWRDALGGGGAAPTALDVWRVEARAGASGVTGVFDLGSDGGAGGPWRLLRAQD